MSSPTTSRFTPEEDRDIIDQYLSGMSLATLVREHHSSYGMITFILRQAGVQLRTEIDDEGERQRIADAYQSGLTLHQVCKMFHHKTKFIKQVLADKNVELRKNLTMNTPIELRLQDALKSMGIGFKTHKRLVGRYVVDIVLNQAPVIIEADGIQHQLHGSAYDHKRDVAHEAAGYRVFRFTGSEINADAGACIKRVIDECALVADAEPVYDVKFVLVGEDHPRWAGGLEVAACENCGSEFSRRRSGRQKRFCTPKCYGAWARKTGALRGKPRTEKQLMAQAKSGENWRGRTHTPDARAKISASRMGKPSWNKGKRMSEESKAKVSAALKGHRDSDETRAKKRAAHLGTKMPEGTGAKISASLKAYHQTKIKSDLT